MKTIFTIDDLAKEDVDYFENLLVDGINKRLAEIVIDLNEYIILTDILKNIIYVFRNKKNSIYNEYLNSVTISGGYYQGNEDIIYAKKIRFTYKLSETEWKNKQNEIDNIIDEIFQPVKKTQSVIDKILYINDYFCMNEYNIETNASLNHGIYDILKNKIGFPITYVQLYKYIFDKLNIPVLPVSASSSFEVTYGEWWLIKVNEEWYHYLIMYNGTYSLDNRFIINKYILKSDEYITEKTGFTTFNTTYYNAPFEEQIQCTSTKYDWLEGDITNG